MVVNTASLFRPVVNRRAQGRKRSSHRSLVPKYLEKVITKAAKRTGSRRLVNMACGPLKRWVSVELFALYLQFDLYWMHCVMGIVHVVQRNKCFQSGKICSRLKSSMNFLCWFNCIRGRTLTLKYSFSLLYSVSGLAFPVLYSSTIQVSK